MTREEFNANITDFSDLLTLCREICCDLLEDVCDEDYRDEVINERLVDMASDMTWQELYRELDNIPDGYGFYRCDEYDDWCGLDNADFEEYARQVYEWMEDNDMFDEEDEDEEEEVDEDHYAYTPTEYDLEPVEQPECSLDEVFAGSTMLIQQIELSEENEDEAAMMSAIRLYEEDFV